MVWMASTLASRSFLLSFLIFAFFVVVFIVNNLLLSLIDDLWLAKILFAPSMIKLVYVVTPFKAIEFKGRWYYEFSIKKTSSF